MIKSEVVEPETASRIRIQVDLDLQLRGVRHALKLVVDCLPVARARVDIRIRKQVRPCLGSVAAILPEHDVWIPRRIVRTEGVA